MTAHDVMPGAQSQPSDGEPSARPAPGWAARGWRLAGQHKLGAGLAALLVAAAVVGVAGGSLSGSTASNGTGAAASSGNANAVVYGKPTAAPAFSLTALAAASAGTADRVSLAQYQGKPLIVNFFASWCAPCQQETPRLARFYKTHHVVVVGVDGNDQPANATAFVKAKGVSYPVGVDGQGLTTTDAYNVSQFPQTFFLNARHQVTYRVFGAITETELDTGVRLMQR